MDTANAVRITTPWNVDTRSEVKSKFVGIIYFIEVERRFAVVTSPSLAPACPLSPLSLRHNP